jgi:Saxitoxin biosynthesis operon protein SxtJ
MNAEICNTRGQYVPQIYTHEDFTRRTKEGAASDRSFGLVFAALFLLISLAPVRTHHPVRQRALVVAILLALVASLRAHWLHPLNRVWTRLGVLMGYVVTPIVMALLFFLVVTPTAFVLRLLGKDLLQLTPVSKTDSYWIERRPPGPSPESMVNQF